MRYLSVCSGIERTLANVLLDIADACQRGGGVRQQGTDFESEALDRLWALRDEAKAIIERATGCTWDQITEANL